MDTRSLSHKKLVDNWPPVDWMSNYFTLTPRSDLHVTSLHNIYIHIYNIQESGSEKSQTFQVEVLILI